MKKWIAVILSFCMLFGVTACSTGERENAGTTEEGRLDASENSVMGQTGSNTLIAYFTWADNTTVDDEEAAIQSALSHYESVGDAVSHDDVDAISSASILPPGNTAQMAEWIQQRIGGDLFSIIVEEPYPSNYDECLDRASDEKAENARPKLTAHIDNMDEYDVIFLGFPNWWYTAPMAIFSFIEEYGLSGKTIVPFCAHGTGGIARSVEDIASALPDSVEVLEPIGVYRSEINSAQPTINEWLEKLGFENKEAPSDMEHSERNLKMIVNGQEFEVTLYDTPAANALYDMLPLELTFEDFNGIEKISYLPEELPTEGEPDGCDPEVGDLCLYAPWGNLSIFYQDFRESNGLIPLGRVENGIETIGNMNDDFSVTLEAVE